MFDVRMVGCFSGDQHYIPMQLKKYICTMLFIKKVHQPTGNWTHIN